MIVEQKQKQREQEGNQRKTDDSIGHSPSEVGNDELGKYAIGKTESAADLSDSQGETAFFGKPIAQGRGKQRPPAECQAKRCSDTENEIEMPEFIGEAAAGGGKSENDNSHGHDASRPPAISKTSGQRRQQSIGQNVYGQHYGGTPATPSELVQNGGEKYGERVSDTVYQGHGDGGNADDDPTVIKGEALTHLLPFRIVRHAAPAQPVFEVLRKQSNHTARLCLLLYITAKVNIKSGWILTKDGIFEKRKPF
jgi:hypothetical protein